VRVFRTAVPFVHSARMQVSRSYPVPVDDVWAALTVSERLAGWYGTYTGTAPSVLVRLTAEADAGGEIAEDVPVTVHVCVPPSRLVLGIPVGEDSWTVALDLAPTPSGTAVTLSQDVEEPEIAAGWAWYLDRLGATLSGDPMPDWAAYT
jgi:uncharacterized protein YndB with AHSA1/START domain